MTATAVPSTRDKLLEAARACLLERGHQASSVMAIARRAGVNHGLVHHYFGSKEQLWSEVVRREAERVREALPTERERFMDGFYVPELLRHPDRMRLAVEFLALATALPAVQAALREHFRLNREALRVRLALPDEAATTLVFGALFGLAIQGNLDSELAVEPAVRRLLERIAPEASRPATRARPATGARPAAAHEPTRRPSRRTPSRTL